MRKSNGLAMGLSLLLGVQACFAQHIPIPFEQLQSRAILSMRVAEQVIGHTSAFPSGASHSLLAPVPKSAVESPTARGTRIPPGTNARKLGAKYFLLNGLHLGMAGLDMALTQRCIDEHRCREGNPLMPHSLAGRISISSALVCFGALVSGELKKQGSNLWWVTPTAGILVHSAGAATGFTHQ